MSHVKKDYIIVKDRHPRISEVLNDCVALCVPSKKGETLASILQKMCTRIQNIEGLSILNTLPISGSCPTDTDYFIMTGTSGTVRRSWATIKSCLMNEIFGEGILTIAGDQLDGSNQYFDSDLIDQLLIYYNGLNRFLLHDDNNETYPTSEWAYVKSGTSVIGIEILIPVTFTSSDIFTIFPNPNGNP